MLCLAASFGLESRLEQGIELVESSLHVCGDASPLSEFEGFSATAEAPIASSPSSPSKR